MQGLQGFSGGSWDLVDRLIMTIIEAISKYVGIIFTLLNSINPTYHVS